MNTTDQTEPNGDEMAMTEALAEAQEDIESLEKTYDRDQRLIGALLDKGDTDKQIREAFEQAIEDAADRISRLTEKLMRNIAATNQLQAAYTKLDEFSTMMMSDLGAAQASIRQRDEDVTTLVHVLQSFAHEHPTLLARVPERFLDGWPVATPREKATSTIVKAVREVVRPEPHGQRIMGVDPANGQDRSGACPLFAEEITGQGMNSGDGVDYCANADVPPHHNS